MNEGDVEPIIGRRQGCWLEPKEIWQGYTMSKIV